MSAKTTFRFFPVCFPARRFSRSWHSARCLSFFLFWPKILNVFFLFCIPMKCLCRNRNSLSNSVNVSGTKKESLTCFSEKKKTFKFFEIIQEIFDQKWLKILKCATIGKSIRVPRYETFYVRNLLMFAIS